MVSVAVIQGPNLDTLGRRSPARYGRKTLKDVEEEIRTAAEQLGAEVHQFQSNHEGALIDWLRGVQDTVHAIIVNPAGLTTYGRSLYDTLKDSELPIAVIHMSSYYKFDDVDLFADLADLYICGMKSRGYVAALEHFASTLAEGHATTSGNHAPVNAR